MPCKYMLIHYQQSLEVGFLYKIQKPGGRSIFHSNRIKSFFIFSATWDQRNAIIQPAKSRLFRGNFHYSTEGNIKINSTPNQFII